MRNNLQNISDILGRDSVHPFPARMAASIALEAISHARTRLKILDPMMGSGTVLALARSKGHFATGVDIDPLAILIGRVWTTAIDKQAVKRAAIKILERAQIDFKLRSPGQAYPHNADQETKKFIRYWFDEHARRQLASLANEIKNCRNKAIQNVLWCSFSRLIIAKQAGASLALDLSHSRPHKHFETAPKKPFAGFLKSVDLVLKNCLSKNQRGRGPTTNIGLGDARSLAIRNNTIDLILTSPPYLNAIDYMRCSKFSLVWMGCSSSKIRAVRSRSIGTEIGQYDFSKDQFADRIIKSLKLNSKMSLRHQAVLRRFIQDMDASIREASRVLVPGGTAIYVVGENTIRGAYVENSKIIATLGKSAGLKLKKEVTRDLPPNRRYLPPPTKTKQSGTMDSRMRREVVLTFLKPAKRKAR